MNRLIYLTLLAFSGFVAQAQFSSPLPPTEIEISAEAGARLNTNENPELTPIGRSELKIEKSWALIKHLSINTGLSVESLLSVKPVSLSLYFDSMISLNYDLTNKKCYDNGERYIIGVAVSPSIISNPIFFEEPLYSTTLGVNTEAEIGILDIKIYFSPLELLNIKDQYTSPLCLDLNAQISVDLDDNTQKNTPMFCSAETHNSELKFSCNLFQRKVLSDLYNGEVKKANHKKEKLTYLDGNLEYQYKIPQKPIKVNVCVGLQTSAGNIKTREAAYINYYCTAGLIFVIPVKN